MKKMIPLFWVALVGLANCSKKNDPVAPTPSRAELLTASSWQLTLTQLIVTPASGGAAITSNYSAVPGDLNPTYNTDGTMLINFRSQLGNHNSGGRYTLVDSVLRSDTPGTNGIIREITANRMILVNRWRDRDELLQRADVFMR